MNLSVSGELVLLHLFEHVLSDMASGFGDNDTCVSQSLDLAWSVTTAL